MRTISRPFLLGATITYHLHRSSNLIAKDLVSESDQVTGPNQEALGINWNLLDDTLSVPVRLYTETKLFSKRDILQRVSSIFDPLGYFNPVVLKAKLLLKKLWMNWCNWNDVVNDELMEEWELISKQLEAISSYQLLRYIGIAKKPDSLIQYHLVCFCDASGVAYATTVYLHQSIPAKQI